ncbi:hypothetical protein NHQ30_002351 [Ciborinia camelliae]|nr:hypothetical protein NHQ30_002351 [Ciborinia camelliae]
MQIPPSDVLSAFPRPNYIDPVTRGPALLIITYVFLPVIYIVVGLRTFTRIHLSKHFGVDDVFLLIALIPTTACAIIALLAQECWEWNRHIWDVSPDYAVLGLKISLLLECLFGLAVASTKISLLILIIRVMSRGRGLLKPVAIAMIICTALPATKPFFCTFLPSLFGHGTRPSDENLHRLPTHKATLINTYQSGSDLKAPGESIAISDIPDPMAGGTEIPDDMTKSRQMLPLSYLGSQSPNEGSAQRQSSNPPSYQQSYHTYDNRDIGFEEASLSIGLYAGPGPGRPTQQSDRTCGTNRASLSTFVTEDPGSPHSSRFSNGLMEVPSNFNQCGKGQELHPSESQSDLIHAR